MVMGYDKKSFLTGLAVGRNMRSYPMLEASEVLRSVNLFWTNTAYYCKHANGEASEYLKLEIADQLYSTDHRMIRYFILHNTGNDRYTMTFIWDESENKNPWPETTYLYTSETERFALGSYSGVHWSYQSGDWWYGFMDSPVWPVGTSPLIPSDAIIFSGTANDLADFLSTASVVSVSGNLYLVGRGS